MAAAIPCLAVHVCPINHSHAGRVATGDRDQAQLQECAFAPECAAAANGGGRRVMINALHHACTHAHHAPERSLECARVLVEYICHERDFGGIMLGGTRKLEKERRPSLARRFTQFHFGTRVTVLRARRFGPHVDLRGLVAPGRRGRSFIGVGLPQPCGNPHPPPCPRYFLGIQEVGAEVDPKPTCVICGKLICGKFISACSNFW